MSESRHVAQLIGGEGVCENEFGSITQVTSSSLPS